MTPVLSFTYMMLRALRALFPSAMQSLTLKYKHSQELPVFEKHKKAREAQINQTFFFYCKTSNLHTLLI